MIRHHSSLAIALFLIVFIIVWAIVAARPASAPVHINRSSNSSLQVINGSQMYTNVTGDNLQQAAPPAGSATSSQLSPQQARPNYCLPGEAPYIDGCVAP